MSTTSDRPILTHNLLAPMIDKATAMLQQPPKKGIRLMAFIGPLSTMVSVAGLVSRSTSIKASTPSLQGKTVGLSGIFEDGKKVGEYDIHADRSYFFDGTIQIGDGPGGQHDKLA